MRLTGESMNVDTNAAADVRANTLWSTINDVENDLDSPPLDAVKKFLLHVAWHEGAGLTARAQFGGGPGRSFYQFEPARAREAIDTAQAKGVVVRLAQALVQDGVVNLDPSQTLDDVVPQVLNARDALPTSFGIPWPSDNQLIEQGLLGSDLFGTYLIRLDLKRIPDPIPSDNLSQAQYWADHWKIKFDSDDQKAALIATFTGEANTVDALLS
jgi:hypothetical protein